MSSWNKETNIKNCGSWLKRKIELIEQKDLNRTRSINPTIQKGGIFNIELGIDNIGGEKNKKRPCLIVSKNNLNMGDTTVVIPLSTKFKTKENSRGETIPFYRNHFIFKKTKYPFLDQDSCIKCEDIRSIDKIRIQEHLGNIDPEDFKMIKNSILFTFDL